MNPQLIEKIISSNETCPNFVYENPLLDQKVAGALARSFVNILKLTSQNSNNSNLRLTVLENIRHLCQNGPNDHRRIDENLTQVITDFYKDNIINESHQEEDNIEKDLDTFLMQSLSQLDINSQCRPQVSAEVIQALINLSEPDRSFKKILDNVFHWDGANTKYKTVLLELWNNDIWFEYLLQNNLFDGICVKMKDVIEKLLLEECYLTLNNREIDIESSLQNNKTLMKLVIICSSSPTCFQMCSNILNYIFIKTNFNTQILKLISVFINLVKLCCNHVAFSILYPSNLSHLVVLLDIDINEIQGTVSVKYFTDVKKELKILELSAENEFIMLLSHFPQWFNVGL